MKFERRIEKDAVPEWRPKYVQYRNLKDILSKLPPAPPDEFDFATGTYKEHVREKMPLNEIEMLFLNRLDLELSKVVEFYNAREKEAIQKKQQILSQLSMLPDINAKQSSTHHLRKLANLSNLSSETMLTVDNMSPSLKIHSFRRRSFSQVARSRIRKAMLEFYRSLELLKNYKSLNLTAFTKIMKKFDKQTQRNMTPEFMESVKSKPFAYSHVPEMLTTNVESIYRRVFTGGDRSKALDQLRIPDARHRSYQFSATFSGILLGLMLAIFSSIIKKVLTGSTATQSLAFIYASLGLPVLLACLFALNIIVWDAIHVNYKFIFNLDHRSVLHSSEFNVLVSSFGLIYLAFTWLSLRGYLDASIQIVNQPWALLITMAGILFLPVPVFFWRSRLWIVKVLGRIATAPFYPVRFKDFFMNDQLMSLGFSIQTLAWLISISFSGAKTIPDVQSAHIPSLWYVAVLSALPAFWRVVQSLRRFADGGFYFFPHMANLIKYAISFSIPFVGLGLSRVPSLFYLRLVLQFSGSVYSLAWDIFMDFGLLQGGVLHASLRENLLFPSPAIYYLLMVFDLVFRFLWLLPFCGPFKGALSPLMTSYCLAVSEVFRRFVWNFFRVEYEQVNNCNTFRAYADIPLPYSAKDLFYHDMVETEIAQHAKEEHTESRDGSDASNDLSGESSEIAGDEDDDDEDEDNESSSDFEDLSDFDMNADDTIQSSQSIPHEIIDMIECRSK